MSDCWSWEIGDIRDKWMLWRLADWLSNPNLHLSPSSSLSILVSFHLCTPLCPVFSMPLISSYLHPPFPVPPPVFDSPFLYFNLSPLSLRTILLSVISLLNEPNTFSPANVDASVMYRKWRDSKGKDREYIEIIRYLEEHAQTVLFTLHIGAWQCRSYRIPVPASLFLFLSTSQEAGALYQSWCRAGWRQGSCHVGRVLRPHTSPTHRRWL